MWLAILSDQLPISGLVSHYLTNYLMGREPIPGRLNFALSSHRSKEVIGY